MRRPLAALIAFLITLSTVVCAISVSTMADSDVTVYHGWDFEDGISGWGDSISSSVQLTYTQEVAETNALAFDFTYDGTEVGNWNNCPFFSSPTYMGKIGEATKLRFDVYLEKGKATMGSIEIYPIVQSPEHNYWFQLPLTEISAVSGGEELENGLMKYTITSDLVDALGNALASTDTIHVMTFCNCGKYTDYSGTIYYDNIQFISVPEEPEAPTELTVSTSLNHTSFIPGNTLTVTCNAQGGTAPYRYTFYALKDGKVEYKSDIWTGVNTADITLNEVGTYKIMAYCRDTTGKKLSVRDEVTVYAEEIKPSAITLSKTSVSIEKGKTATVTASISPENAMNKTVTWTSNKTAVATVDENGVIKAIGVGSAVITVTTANGLTATVSVTVTAPVVAEKYIALTFDDGPDANTGKILDTLKEKNAKATFFVLHSNAQYYTSLLTRAAEEGHEIGNHTKTHPSLTTLSDEEALEEINYVNDFIYEHTGKTPNLYRPPNLAYNGNVLSLFPNMSAIGCSIDTQDWAGKTASEITSKILDNAKNGDIVLMHVFSAETRAALPDIIDGLYEKGFECVTVSELFELNNKKLSGGTYYSCINY